MPANTITARPFTVRMTHAVRRFAGHVRVISRMAVNTRRRAVIAR